MTSLTSYVSSERQQATNNLSSKSAPVKVFVYVESFADVGFWHGILSPYEKQNNIKFDISPYSENDLTTGKDKLIKLFPQTNQYFIICLDSDYDYLLQTIIVKKINDRKPYIFQTYAYAIENLKCYAESLNTLCVRATNNTDETVNLSVFLKEYSRIIYPLLIWNIYFEYINEDSRFSREEFGKIVTVDDITPSNYQEKLTIIQSSINEKLSIFSSNASFVEFHEKINKLELNDTNAYLFMNGHHLYGFLANFLVKICETLKNNRKTEIEELAKNLPEEKRNEVCKAKIGEYFNPLVSIRHLLAHNDKFTDCFLFKKIEKDIENYLVLFKNIIPSR